MTADCHEKANRPTDSPRRRQSHSRCSAGWILGFLLGLLVLVLVPNDVFHRFFGAPTEKGLDLYFPISGILGAITGAILGVTIGQREILGGETQDFGKADRRFFHPLGMLVGLVCGTILGAALAYLFIDSPHPQDAHDALVATCAIGILGSIGGGFVGPTGWKMFGGALVGWILLGTGFVLTCRNRIGVIFGACVGVPLGALFAFLHWLDKKDSGDRLTPKKTGSSPSATVWDRELDS